MRDSIQPSDHPVDALPDVLRGRRADAAAIERHLSGCASCRSELDVLRALAGSAPAPLSDLERERLHGAIESRRAAGDRRPGGGAGGRPGDPAGPHPWLAWTWRAAAGIALVLMSIGVLRVVQEGATPDWDPGLALDGWGREVADLGLDPADVRLALGVGILDDPTLGLPLDEAGADLEGMALPWEEEDR